MQRVGATQRCEVLQLVAEEVYNMQILKSVAQKYRNSKSISNISKKNQKCLQ